MDVGEDMFIPPNEINGAMQGDLVLVDEMPPDRGGRRSGRIARVLTRRNPTVVGIFPLRQQPTGCASAATAARCCTATMSRRSTSASRR